MAERANDEILQLAGQGNLQALSVYLNRHLIPSGAHVKVKQKEEALHVLIVAMSDSENAGLIDTVQKLVVGLRPARVTRVKVYTQVLGQTQASLRQQFSIKSTADRQAQTPPVIYSGPPPSERFPSPSPSRQTFAPSAPPSIAKDPNFEGSTTSESAPAPSASAPSLETRRYSVVEFLAQATNLEDLSVLHDHPFFTGVCPNCHHQFPQASQPPTYWDCPKCGWKDDLSGVMPLRDSRDCKSQISLVESKRLGDYLVEAGLLKASQIEVALADQGTTGLRFGEVLVRRGWVKEETIEYLMQKIILPERRGNQSGASYLESSRNLLKTLLKSKPAPPVAADSPFSSPPVAPLEAPKPPKPPNPSTQDSKSSDSTPAPAKVAPFSSGKLANERETLILPDIELDELDAYLNGSHAP
ncbi:hypothetical protein [Altericista sp. CCNU0014]|uniref:hypothetical protein n=1 Tax=Altericista sp. CCNU0014 TaxID=3082949 RepID=UPI00384CF73A